MTLADLLRHTEPHGAVGAVRKKENAMTVIVNGLPVDLTDADITRIVRMMRSSVREASNGAISLDAVPDGKLLIAAVRVLAATCQRE